MSQSTPLRIGTGPGHQAASFSLAFTVQPIASLPPAATSPTKLAFTVGLQVDERPKYASAGNPGDLGMGRGNRVFSAEILCNIFWMMVDHRTRAETDSVATEAKALVYCSQLCSFWRETALGYGRPWGQIFQVEVNRTPWLRILVQRSAHYPVSIVSGSPLIKSSERLFRTKELQENWLTIFNLHARWENFYVRIGDSSYWRHSRFQEVLGRPCPLLRSFTLLQQSSHYHGMTPCNSTFLGGFLFTTNLKVLQIRGAWPLYILHDPTIPVQNLTHLVVHHYGLALDEDNEHDYTPTAWLRIISGINSLESLVLSNCIFPCTSPLAPPYPHNIDQEYRNQPPTFQSLQHLRITGYGEASSELIHSIRYPEECVNHITGIMITGDVSELTSILDKVGSSLKRCKFIATSFRIDISHNFIISAYNGQQRTFHFELEWSGHRLDVPSLIFAQPLGVFIDFLCEFTKIHSPTLRKVSTLSVGLGSTLGTPIFKLFDIFTHFPAATTLHLLTVGAPDLRLLYSHHHAVSDIEGRQVIHLLPKISSLVIDVTAIKSDGTTPAVQHSRITRIENALLLRSSIPISTIDSLSFATPPPFSDISEMDKDPVEFSIADDVVPYLSSAFSGATVHLVDCVDGLRQGPSETFFYDKNGVYGEDIEPLSFDETYIQHR